MMMDEKNLLEECRAMCIRMRKNSLKMSLAAGEREHILVAVCL